MNKQIRLIFSCGIVILFSLSTINIANADNQFLNTSKEDFDPLVDIEVTVTIHSIRSLEKQDKQLFKREFIDLIKGPDFYIKIFINGNEFTSKTWENTKYLYNIDFSATYNVPDDNENVDVIIQLWDAPDGIHNRPRLCDISPDEGITADSYDVELVYNILNGHWTGDDSVFDDESGYGRLNGCDDGTIYMLNRDCELWFSIKQNDYDNDNIPYWMEVNEYGTNPMISDLGSDEDLDGIPIEWEWKWGYDPFEFDNHDVIDPELDGLDNYEEYLTSEWDSNPYRDDIYVELDHMEEGPNGEFSDLPEGSKELLYTAFNRQNKVFHLDDGSMGGGEEIPFDEETNKDELRNIYREYFYHGTSWTWRRSVFHYGVVIYGYTGVAGAVFGNNRFYITGRGHEKKASELLMDRDEVFASAYMHELGHTFDFGYLPGHSRNAMYPWQIGWWLNRPYRSCMNYGYMYYTVDYSDGSHPNPIDFDDWERMDLRAFQWT
jgi:hypothetical protein